MTLEGRKILVVGASSGMGRGTAIAMAKGGADVVFAARRSDLLEEAVREAGSGHVVPIDVRDPDSIDAAVATAVEQLGSLDALLYTPGLSYVARLRAMTPQRWNDVLAVNLVGPNLTIAAALPHLSEHGVIAVVSSDSSAEPRHSLVPYGCSKAALEAAMEGWRTEEIGGRRFVTIVLGPTRPSDFSRDFDPDEFASLFPYWQRQGFRTGSLATPEVSAYLAQSFGFLFANPGFGHETLLLRAPEPADAVTDYGTGLGESDTMG
jgi:NAD(P)-dependent dehydrogenase (short-subunit alcohol dehydrogenase family)